MGGTIGTDVGQVVAEFTGREGSVPQCRGLVTMNSSHSRRSIHPVAGRVPQRRGYCNVADLIWGGHAEMN